MTTEKAGVASSRLSDYVSKRIGNAATRCDSDALRHWGWIVAGTRRFRRYRNAQTRDAMQIGALHLCKSLRTHDARKGKVLTYCGDSIHAVMAQWMFAQIKWAEAKKPLREDHLVQDDSFLEEAVYRSECRETVSKLLKHLSYRERLVIKMRCEEDTLVEVGRELGVTAERARQLERRAHAKMKNAAIQYGIVCP